MDLLPPLSMFPLTTHVVRVPIPTATLPPESDTNTYIIFDPRVSVREAVLVDAGSNNPQHIRSLLNLLQQLGIRRVNALVATHYHADHVSGLPALQESLQAPIFLHEADRHAALRVLAREKDAVHPHPDFSHGKAPASAERSEVRNLTILPLPDVLNVGNILLKMHHAPGHTHGHIHVEIADDAVVLVGDHLSGMGTVWVGPPDGHMVTYYKALTSLIEGSWEVAGPGHGFPLIPAAYAAKTLLDRRHAREEQILTLLQKKPRDRFWLTRAIYPVSVLDQAGWVAERTVQAHLQYLLDGGLVRRHYHPDTGFMYSLCEMNGYRRH